MICGTTLIDVKQDAHLKQNANTFLTDNAGLASGDTRKNPFPFALPSRVHLSDSFAPALCEVVVSFISLSTVWGMFCLSPLKHFCRALSRGFCKKI